MHPYFHIFGKEIPAYWAWGMVGVCMAGLYLFFTNRNKKAGHLPPDDLLHICLMALVGAIVGAKLLYVLTLLPTLVKNWAIIVATPWVLLPLLLDGLVFYGGMLGAVLAGLWYCRKYKVSIATTLGITVPAIPLFHAFGRIGCFFGGCCYGVPVSWGVAFPNPISGAPTDIPLLPVQLIEAACNFGIFLLLAFASRHLAQKWLVLPLYLFLYGIVRFVLEFFRGDQIRGVWLLSTSQWISLGMIALALVLFFTRKRWHTQKNR